MKIKGNFGSYPEREFKKGVITCAVCGNTHHYHCSVTVDDGLALCKYVSSEKIAKDGRYEHILKGISVTANNKIVKPLQKEITASVKADDERLNAVYTALLDGLKLTPSHNNQLLEQRGLFDTTIARNLYASVPNRNKRFEIGHKLSKSFNLEGVPGFFIQDGIWCLNISYSGFYVPYRNEKGLITGLQIRKDKQYKQDDSKYFWLSSDGKEKGCKSGTPLHFINSERIKTEKKVFITEGGLKADVIGDLATLGVVATAGVGTMNPETFTDILFKEFPDLQEVVLAFDMDWKIKEAVNNAIFRLLNVLIEKPISVSGLIWDETLGKGLDDVLFKKPFQESIAEIPCDEVLANNFRNMLLASMDEIIKNKAKKVVAVSPLPVITHENEETYIQDKEVVAQAKTTLGWTWREFSKAKFEIPERVITGLSRGNVGQLVAATNIGKTTIILNLAISASTNQVFEPFLNELTVGKRIMYIDGEATKAELQADINKMLESCSSAEQELIKDNLYLFCDEEIEDEPLDLVKPVHLQKVLEEALVFKPDLIVIDTLSAMMTVEDENDNAKMKKEVIQPLKNLAKKANAAVLLLHHSGKYNEGSPQAIDAYKGRGASALGALCRTVFNLKSVSDKRVILSCSKIKGEKFENVVLELDQDSRWFGIVNDASAKTTSKPDKNYERVVKFVQQTFEKTKIAVKRSEIDKYFNGNPSTSTITRKLDEAETRGILVQPEYGYYLPSEIVDSNQELPLKE